MTPPDSYANLTSLASAAPAFRGKVERLRVLLERARIGAQDPFRRGERPVTLPDVITTTGIAPDRSADIAKFM